jgi:hypothetical protein
MTFQRGDVVLIPFPYSDLTARKTRPAVVVSDAVYHSARSEFLGGSLSAQDLLTAANLTEQGCRAAVLSRMAVW